jgi:hypothetical protein
VADRQSVELSAENLAIDLFSAQACTEAKPRLF